jgi:ferredoxin
MDPIKLTIDGKEVATTKGKTVIETAAEIGIDIPHYCYHQKLSIAGNCRMCLVEIEKMPKLQIACNTQAAEGMSVLTQSPKVLAIRKAVMEFLLVNHPLDCPICDQAGECWLQDYYMKHDLQGSRFEERRSTTASGKFSVPTLYSTASAASNVRAACASFRKLLEPTNWRSSIAAIIRPSRCFPTRFSIIRFPAMSLTSARWARSRIAIFASKFASGICRIRRPSVLVAAPAAT